MPRPFATRLAHSRVQGELRIDLTFAGRATSEQQQTLGLLLGEIAAFLGCGALGGQHLDPASASARAEAPTISEADASQRFSDARLDVGAVACLLNIVEWTHHHVLPIDSVRIAWDRLPEVSESGAIAFPAMWPALAYALRFDDDRDRRFAVEVGFRQPQPEETLRQINEDIFVWFTAVNRGAYGSDGGFPPGESFLYLTDDPVQSFPTQVTWFIDRFHCEEDALVGLANALHRIHHTRAPLSHVEVG